MKCFSIILLLIGLWSSFESKAQNITFEQVQNLRTKSLAHVETFLSSKGWSMTNAEKATEDKMGKAVFGYQVDAFDIEKASSWLIFYQSSIEADYNRIKVQVNTNKVYNEYLGRLAPNGYKLKKSSIVDGGIEKVYANSTTTCVVRTGTANGMFSASTVYNFTFVDNIDYSIYFEE